MLYEYAERRLGEVTEPTRRKAKSFSNVVFCFLACYAAAQATWCGIAVFMLMDLLFGIFGGFIVSVIPTVVCSALLAVAYQIVWVKFGLRWHCYLVSLGLTATVFGLISLAAGDMWDVDLAWMTLMCIPGLMGALAADLVHRWRVGAPVKRVQRPGMCPVCRRRAADDAIRFGDKRVCLKCKPIYVQQLKEGIAGT